MLPSEVLCTTSQMFYPQVVASRRLEANFYGLGLGAGLETFCIGLGLRVESCIDNFSSSFKRKKNNKNSNS